MNKEWSEIVRALVRWGYVPLMLIGVNSLAFYIVFTHSSSVSGAIALGVLMAVALILSYSAERILPYLPAWNQGRGDTLRDITHFGVNESLSLGPTLIAPLFAAATTPSPEAALWPLAWPLGLQLVFALLVFDLGQTLFHWASHVWPPLWRFHAVHHEVQRMYGLNGILKHPLYQVLASVASMAPLLALGMPKSFSLAIAFSSFVQLLIQHANVDYRTGIFRRVFATAEVHRFHHLRGKRGDVNFALFFSFFDHLLGNAYDSPLRLSSDQIGLDDRSYPKNWLGQMGAPFRRSRPDSRPNSRPKSAPQNA